MYNAPVAVVAVALPFGVVQFVSTFATVTGALSLAVMTAACYCTSDQHHRSL